MALLHIVMRTHPDALRIHTTRALLAMEARVREGDAGDEERRIVDGTFGWFEACRYSDATPVELPPRTAGHVAELTTWFLLAHAGPHLDPRIVGARPASHRDDLGKGPAWGHFDLVLELFGGDLVAADISTQQGTGTKDLLEIRARRNGGVQVVSTELRFLRRELPFMLLNVDRAASDAFLARWIDAIVAGGEWEMDPMRIAAAYDGAEAFVARVATQAELAALRWRME